MKHIHTILSRSPLAAAAVAMALLGAASATRPAAAQPADAASLCTPDVMRLCNEFIPDRERIVACLKAKRSQLSAGCRGVMSPGGARAAHEGTVRKAGKKKRRHHSRHHG